MDQSAILGKICTYNSSNSTASCNLPPAIFLLLCNFFPNRTLVHAITYTNT